MDHRYFLSVVGQQSQQVETERLVIVLLSFASVVLPKIAKWISAKVDQRRIDNKKLNAEISKDSTETRTRELVNSLLEKCMENSVNTNDELKKALLEKDIAEDTVLELTFALRSEREAHTRTKDELKAERSKTL